MIKRLLFVFMALLLAMPPLAVSADLVIEPDNNFYKQYSDQCVKLGRNFCVNDADGYINLKREPGAKGGICRIKNDEIIYIEYSCLYDGEYWGLTTYREKSGGFKTGWVKTEQLLVLYDYVAFEEDHFDEFYQYTGDLAKLKETEAAIVWAWPGSGKTFSTISSLDADSVHISYAYKDEQGREWGFVPYLYGSRNFWICVSDPVNRDIPFIYPAPDPVKWESETEHTEIEKTDNAMIIIIIVLVVTLVAGTAILIRVFWKPQNENTLKGD